jgi:serine/threonine protein kinase
MGRARKKLAKLKLLEQLTTSSAMPTRADTAQGTILGTLQYMSPEQVEGQNADARSDIFAFGAVVYEMLAGRKAFEGKSTASLISAILRDTPAPISIGTLTPDKQRTRSSASTAHRRIRPGDRCASTRVEGHVL